MKFPLRSILTTLSIALLVLFGGAEDSAAQWKKVTNLPQPYDAGYYLDVFFLPSNPQYGWVCGYDGFMLRTTDGGATWQGTTIPANNPSPPRSPMLESVSFTTPLIGYTSGNDGIYKTVDGGSTWSDVTPPNITRQRLWGCFFINANVGLVVGGGCTIVDQNVIQIDYQSFYRTTDGGNTWSEFRGNYDNSGMSDAMIYSEDGLGYASSSGLIWKTLDGGKTWKEFSKTGIQYWQEEITNIGSSFLVPSAGTKCDGAGLGGALRFSTDNGTSWINFNTGEEMFGTFLLDTKSGWGVGSNRAVYYTNDGGRTWDIRNCGIEIDDDLDDVFFITDSIGWTVGDGVYHTYYPKPLLLTINASGPLFICDGDSVTLLASEGFGSYTWSNGSKERITTVGKSGKYIVTAFDKDLCTFTHDTVEVTVYPRLKAKITSSNPKYIICFGDTLVLTGSQEYIQYRWSNGDTSRQISITIPGDYTLSVVDTNGCIGVSDTIHVKAIPFIKPVITAKRNFTFCQGDSLKMNAPPGYSQYLWSNGTTAQSFTTKIGGPFTVIVVDSNGCVGMSDTVIAIELIARNKLQIEVSNGLYEYDSTEIGIRNCQDITLYNRDSILPYILDNPYLVKNLFFSVPQSQLPIVIPPLDTIYLQVCFAPFDTSQHRDTLIFEDTCSQQSLPLVAVGKSILADGTSRCDVPLAGVNYSLGASYALSAPYPQPSSTIATITLTVVEASSQQQSLFFPAQLKDIFGMTAATAEQHIESTLIRKEQRETRINLTFDTHNLGTGIYYVYVSLGNNVKVIPLIIQH